MRATGSSSGSFPAAHMTDQYAAKGESYTDKETGEAAKAAENMILWSSKDSYMAGEQNLYKLVLSYSAHLCYDEREQIWGGYET